MIVKFLGLIDIVCAFIILFAEVLPYKLIIYFSFILAVKGAFFFFTGSLISLIDVLCAVYMISLAFGFSVILISIIFFIYLLQKSFMSLIA